MRAWLRQHRLALVSALRRVGMLNALVIGIALALPAGGYALLESLRTLAAKLPLDTEVSVFLEPEAKRAEAQALAESLRRDSRIADVRLVPREEALKELSGIEGMSEVLAALGRNPLPDALIVRSRQTRLEGLASDLERLPGVVHVQADAAWARRLAALTSIGRLALALLAAILGAGLVAVTFNTIRLQILTRRAEIEVSKLIGATDAFIRRPFYYLGFLQGLVGGCVALVLVAAGLALLNREVRVLAESYGSAFRFAFPSAADALAIVLLAALLGWLGAHLSVSRHLSEIEPR